MSDDNTMNPASPGDFIRDLVMSRLGFTRPGPGDDTLASLEAAMARGRLTMVASSRQVAFKLADRRWIRDAHRAGAVSSAEFGDLRGGAFPLAASQWPATDLVIELVRPLSETKGIVIRVQVRDDHRLPVRISAFMNGLDPHDWSAVEPFTVSRDGFVDFEHPFVFRHPFQSYALARLQQRIVNAAGLVSERHQRLTAERH